MFFILVNTSTAPLISDGSTVPQISNICFSFNPKTKLSKEYDLYDKALKKLLLGAVDEIFFRSLQTKYIGYLNVTTRQISNHLYNQYAWISAADIQENNFALKNA